MNNERSEEIHGKYESLFSILSVITPSIGIIAIFILNYYFYKTGEPFESTALDLVMYTVGILGVFGLVYLTYITPKRSPELFNKFVRGLRDSHEGQEGFRNAIKLINFFLILLGTMFVIYTLMIVFFSEYFTPDYTFEAELSLGVIVMFVARKSTKKLLTYST